MRVLPILFNTEMVRAILDGRKSCTRRLVRKSIENKYQEYDEWVSAVIIPGSTYLREKEFYEKYPPYQLGDILYVRETWCGLPVNEAGHFRGHPIYYYRADGDLRPEGWGGAWNPSIHMPKEAARIWLRVTNVRVERLQDIGYMDCIHEGTPYKQIERDIIKGFLNLWDSTIKKSDLDRYGWYANPFVWVIEFERCEKPEVN